MTIYSMTQLIPGQFLQPLKILGRYEWLRWERVPTDPPSTSFELRIPNVPELRQHYGAVQTLCAMVQAGQLSAFEAYAKSKLLAYGPKVLRPRTEQCEALEHVDVNITFREYQQPFPVFMVDVPDEFRRRLTERFRHKCPRFVITFHDRRTRYIVSMCQGDGEHNGTFNILSSRPQWNSVEDALRHTVDTDGPDLQLGQVLFRVAINFGLLLTRFGAKDCGPVDPKAFAHQQQVARRKKGRKAQRARELLSGAMNLISFEQDVVLFDKPHSPNQSSGEGAGKRPHWRRGHFRRQRCGAGRCERRLIFVPPCFIRADAFQGDQANTCYSIRTRQGSQADDEVE